MLTALEQRLGLEAVVVEARRRASPAAARLAARALDAGRFRLRLPARGRREARPRPGHAALSSRTPPNVSLIGPPGVGETMPAVCLARAAGPGRAPGLLHLYRRPGCDMPQGLAGGPLGHRHPALRRAPAAGRGRTRVLGYARGSDLGVVPGYPATPHQRLHRAYHQPGPPNEWSCSGIDGPSYRLRPGQGSRSMSPARQPTAARRCARSAPPCSPRTRASPPTPTAAIAAGAPPTTAAPAARCPRRPRGRPRRRRRGRDPFRTDQMTAAGQVK